MLPHYGIEQKNSGFTYAHNDGKGNLLQTGFSICTVFNYRFELFYHAYMYLAIANTRGVTANYLMYLVWRAAGMLQIAGLQVICIVADGATPNRKIFKLHKIEELMKSGVTCVAPNVCSKPGNHLYRYATLN